MALYYKCLAICLVSPSSVVRTQAVKDLCNIGKTLGGVQVVTSVFQEMVNIMSIKNVTMDRIDSGQGGDLGASDSVHVASVLASVSGRDSNRILWKGLSKNTRMRTCTKQRGQKIQRIEHQLNHQYMLIGTSHKIPFKNPSSPSIQLIKYAEKYLHTYFRFWT